MEQVERDRVRVLAESVSLKLEEESTSALEQALEATLVLLRDTELLAEASGDPETGAFDPAWTERGKRR